MITFYWFWRTLFIIFYGSLVAVCNTCPWCLRKNGAIFVVEKWYTIPFFWDILYWSKELTWLYPIYLLQFSDTNSNLPSLDNIKKNPSSDCNWRLEIIIITFLGISIFTSRCGILSKDLLCKSEAVRRNSVVLAGNTTTSII